MRLWPLALLLGVGLAGAASASPVDNDNNGGNVTLKQRIWSMLTMVPELTNEQRFFLMLTAYGEGGYNPRAHNGTPAERAASQAAADNNPSIVAWAQSCGVPRAELETGSWTTFQLLAPYVTGTVREVFGDAGCMFADPTRVGDNLALQVALAIEHARDLQGYSSWQAYPTVGNLRLGWAAPSLMGYISANAERLNRYRAQAASQSFPAGIVDASLTRFPGNAASIYERLRGAAASSGSSGAGGSTIGQQHVRNR